MIKGLTKIDRCLLLINQTRIRITCKVSLSLSS